jgi:MarR family transcriptional regulator, lower aerobic nicotinate degradation pathway regulator
MSMTKPPSEADPRLPLADLYARPGFLLRRAHQIAVGIFVQECSGFGLTPPQHSALIAVGHCPGLDQAALARALGFDRATIGQVVEGLESRGLLRRRDSPTDKRRKTLALSAKGRALMSQASAAIARTSERLLAPLAAKEREHFVRLLRQLTGELNGASRTPVTHPALPVDKKRRLRRSA